MIIRQLLLKIKLFARRSLGSQLPLCTVSIHRMNYLVGRWKLLFYHLLSKATFSLSESLLLLFFFLFPLTLQYPSYFIVLSFTFSFWKDTFSRGNPYLFSLCPWTNHSSLSLSLSLSLYLFLLIFLPYFLSDFIAFSLFLFSCQSCRSVSLSFLYRLHFFVFHSRPLFLSLSPHAAFMRGWACE